MTKRQMKTKNQILNIENLNHFSTIYAINDFLNYILTFKIRFQKTKII